MRLALRPFAKIRLGPRDQRRIAQRIDRRARHDLRDMRHALVRGRRLALRGQLLASDMPSLTPENAAGCQEIAMSTSRNAPPRTMKHFAAPPSSAGQP